MKRLLILLFLPLMTIPLVSLDNKGLLNQRAPIPKGETLDGITIDSSYFKGHITLLTCMYIGCQGCMTEIGTLNRLKAEFAGQQQVQILCVARQMRQQMIEFNDSGKTIYSQLRKAFGAPPIHYTIIPGCEDKASTMEKTGDYVHLNSECTTIEDLYHIDAYPTLFYIDRDGLIRKIATGGPPAANDTAFYREIKMQVDKMLAEN